MLKRYVSQDRVQWTGKAWEVRYALRRAKRQSGGDVRLADWLAESAKAAKR
ncbi:MULTISPECIES: hypothetical protein [Cohnella]|uniref:hypothetical protein n=1 Tax=Cohnella TaxID=329857 RepID=UPI0015937B13|nr:MULTISPECIES: hypothetical protein [Cohnella]MBN2984391.1 hypothetical protein [Cohnella algarum]